VTVRDVNTSTGLLCKIVPGQLSQVSYVSLHECVTFLVGH